MFSVYSFDSTGSIQKTVEIAFKFDSPVSCSRLKLVGSRGVQIVGSPQKKCVSASSKRVRRSEEAYDFSQLCTIPTSGLPGTGYNAAFYKDCNLT